jgi:threonine dehydrogenase-like Zn-dependent dehydrogenase
MTTHSACGSAPIGGSWKGSSAAQAPDGGRPVLEFFADRGSGSHSQSPVASARIDGVRDLGRPAAQRAWCGSPEVELGGSRPSPAASADVVYEGTGVPSLFQSTAELVRRGGTLALLGYPMENSSVSYGD